MSVLVRTSYFLIFFIILFETMLVFRKMKTRTHYYLFMNCLSMLICCVGSLVMNLCSNDETYFYGLVFSWLGRVWVIISTMFFIITHCKYKIPEIVKVLESVLSLILFVSILTTRYTGLFYKDYHVDFSGEVNILHYSKGPFGILWFINVMSIMFICTVVLYLSISVEKSVRRRNQYKLIIVALGSEFIVGFVTLAPFSIYFDFNLVGFAVCAIVIIIATFTNNLFDIETATKDYIVDDLSSGVIAIDKYGDIAYYNKMIGKVFPFIEASPHDAIDHVHWLIRKNQLLTIDDKSYRFEKKQFDDDRFKDMTIYAMTDVTAYYNHLKDVEKQKAIADEANKLKSFFLASMSHEIRTPINTVLGMDEMILLENNDPEINNYARRIQSAGKTLLGLINDILDFSKLEAGKIEIVPVKYDLLTMIDDLVCTAQSLANDKGLSFEVDIDKKTPRHLIGDESRIKQCITNLLTNAVKYTEKGKVTFGITCEKYPSSGNVYLKIYVKDTGIGIKPEDMDKLLSAFERLDIVRNRNIKGTGLGLAITNQLIEKMGSELSVESEYDKGSKFSFVLSQEIAGTELVGEYKFGGSVYEECHKSNYDMDSFRAPDACILVVDDTENNLFVFESLLKRTGIKIDTATGARQMLKMVKEKKYDIIYLDHMMPDMDGIEALHEMKNMGEFINKSTPVIALTANAIYGSRDFYLGEGFTDYMSKPVSYGTIKASLEKYLSDDKKDYKEIEDTTLNDNESSDSADDELALYESRGIDINAGIQNSGSAEILLKVINGFRESIDDSADTIEKELNDGDIKNYTVHVHALKSSARLIGAMRLSSMALNLEKTGYDYLDAEKEGDGDESEEILSKIRELTPELLTYYRSFKEILGKPDDNDDAGSDKELPEIDPDDLNEMLAAMKELAEAFDVDNVDSVMATISTYRIPDDKKPLIDDLKKAVRNVDFDLIISLLSGV